MLNFPQGCKGIFINCSFNKNKQLRVNRTVRDFGKINFNASTPKIFDKRKFAFYGYISFFNEARNKSHNLLFLPFSPLAGPFSVRERDIIHFSATGAPRGGG